MESRATIDNTQWMARGYRWIVLSMTVLVAGPLVFSSTAFGQSVALPSTPKKRSTVKVVRAAERPSTLQTRPASEKRTGVIRVGRRAAPCPAMDVDTKPVAVKKTRVRGPHVTSPIKPRKRIIKRRPKLATRSASPLLHPCGTDRARSPRAPVVERRVAETRSNQQGVATVSDASRVVTSRRRWIMMPSRDDDRLDADEGKPTQPSTDSTSKPDGAESASDSTSTTNSNAEASAERASAPAAPLRDQ